MPPAASARPRPAAASALAPLLLGLSSCCGGGSPGVLLDVRPDTGFVAEKSVIYLRTSQGIERANLDGSGRAVVLPGSYHVVDVSDDLRTFALGNQDTELFVGDASTGAVRQVAACGRRCSAAALSPDGKRLAIGRHADFSLPQSSWKDDDTIYLVDVQTLASETLPPSTDDWPASIGWSSDGRALWVTMNFSKPPQWITLDDKARHAGSTSPPSPLASRRRHALPSCPATLSHDKWATSITLDEPGKPPHAVATLQGRKRGFHDYQADFDHASLTPGCGYVVFEHRQQVWIADARGPSAVASLGRGSWLFFGP